MCVCVCVRDGTIQGTGIDASRQKYQYHAGLEEGIWDWSGKTKLEEYIDNRPVAKFPWVGSFEENVDIILQPIKVQEQLKSLYDVCIAHIHEGIQ